MRVCQKFLKDPVFTVWKFKVRLKCILSFFQQRIGLKQVFIGFVRISSCSLWSFLFYFLLFLPLKQSFLDFSLSCGSYSVQYADETQLYGHYSYDASMDLQERMSKYIDEIAA